MLKPRPAVLHKHPGFAPGLVYGRMGQFMAEMRCQIFHNRAGASDIIYEAMNISQTRPR